MKQVKLRAQSRGCEMTQQMMHVDFINSTPSLFHTLFHPLLSSQSSLLESLTRNFLFRITRHIPRISLSFPTYDAHFKFLVIGEPTHSPSVNVIKRLQQLSRFHLS